jgi:hypothetical protein
LIHGGILTQYMQQHERSGHTEFRGEVKRKHLLATGVTIRAGSTQWAKRQKGADHPGSKRWHTRYANAKCSGKPRSERAELMQKYAQDLNGRPGIGNVWNGFGRARGILVQCVELGWGALAI